MSRLQNRRTEQRASLCNKADLVDDTRLDFPEIIGRDLLRMYEEKIKEDIQRRESEEHFPDDFDKE